MHYYALYLFKPLIIILTYSTIESRENCARVKGSHIGDNPRYGKIQPDAGLDAGHWYTTLGAPRENKPSHVNMKGPTRYKTHPQTRTVLDEF